MSTIEEHTALESNVEQRPISADSAKPARRERRDSARHREHILVVARELFARQGVDATTMYEIARAAGVGQGTLYRHFAHKGLLCMALLEENLRQFRDEVHRRIAADGAEASALAQLDCLLTQLTHFNEQNAPLLGAIGDAACGERRAGFYQSPFYRWLAQTVEVLLHRAVQQGESGALDVEACVAAVLAPLSIDVYLYQSRVLGYSPERIIAALRRLLFDGLRGNVERRT